MSIKSFRYFAKGIELRGETSDPTDNLEGSLFQNSTSNRLKTYIQGAVREIVTNSQTQTLTNKTIDATQNTLSNIPNTSMATVLADASKFLVRDASGAVVSNTKAVPTGIVVGTSDTQTLTNKTLSGNESSNFTNSGNTVTLPAATDTLVGKATTDTLTNKTFDANGTGNSISNIETADLASGVLNTSTSLAGASNSQVPSALAAKTYTDNAITTAAVSNVQGPASATDNAIARFDTTTGKLIQNSVVTVGDTGVVAGSSIDASTNTLTNIANSAISSSAAIARSKLANGTNSAVVFNNGSGVMTDASDLTVGTNALTLANTKHIEFQAATDSTTTGSNASLTAFNGGAVRLTNGSLASIANIPAGSNGQELTLINRVGIALTIIDSTSAVGTAANRILTGTSANLVLAIDASIKLQYDSTTSRWQVVGGSGSGSSASSGINYISNYTAETDTTGWATYADAAGTSPVDGTGGSPTVTLTRTTSAPLRGIGSFLITKDAANRQGNGVSYDFTIDSADKGKVLQGSFDYAIASGTYADNDISIWIYDVTNAALIQPAPYLLKNTTINDKMFFEFQTSISSTSYRLIFHVASTSASAYTIKYDNVLVGPQGKLYGSAITDWVAYTPTISGIGTATSVAFSYKRMGDLIAITGNFVTGTPTAAAFSVTLPSGLTIDSTKVTNNKTTSGVITSLSGTNASIFPTTSQGSWIAFPDTSTTNNVIYGAVSTSSGVYAKANGSTFYNSSTAGSIYFEVPVTGWASSQVMSNDADTRVVAMRAETPTGSVPTTAAQLVFPTVSFDTHGAYNSSTGTYTVAIPGIYRVSSTVSIDGTFTAGADAEIFLLKSGTGFAYSRNDQGGNFTGLTATVSSSVSCIAGDTITVKYATAGITGAIYLGTANTNHGNNFTIERISGPSQIAASETVAASYYGSANFSASTTTPINFDSKEYDSHGAVTPSSTAWKFTAPIAGIYSLAGFLSGGAGVQYNLYKNGSIYKPIGYQAASAASTLSGAIKLLAGEFIDVRPSASATISGGTLSAGQFVLSITRTGNY